MTHPAHLASAHPVEDTFEVPLEASLPPQLDDEPAAPSIDARIANVETSIELITTALRELADAVNAQNGAIEILSQVPDRTQKALNQLAHDQSNINLELALKLDITRGLVTDLQDVVEEMREDFADLDDEEDVQAYFDIETEGGGTFMPVGDIVHEDGTLTEFKTVSDEHLHDLTFTITLDDVDEELVQEIFANGKTLDELFDEAFPMPVTVEGEWISVQIPSRPDLSNLDEANAFRRHLALVAHAANMQGLISDQLSGDLVAVLNGVEADAPEMQRLVFEESPGIAESLKVWWEVGEEATLNIHMMADVELAMTQTIMTAMVCVATGVVFTALMEAGAEAADAA